MKGRSYLELGRRQVFGRDAKKEIGPVASPPDPAAVADFDLGTWRVCPSTARMTRADRIVALEEPELRTLLCLVEASATGLGREVLAARVFGRGERSEERLKRVLSFLRRVFSEDGVVQIEFAPGDGYRLVVGAPVRGEASPGDGTAAATAPTAPTAPAAPTAPTAPAAPTAPTVATALPRAAAVRRQRHRWTSSGIALLIVAGLGAGFWALLDGGSQVILGRVAATTTLAAEPGAERSPSFSPDGRQIVYSWRPPGERDAKLFVRGVETARDPPRPLTTAPGDDLYPAWSPAGGLIAFVRVDGPQCELWTIVPDGTGERRVAECSVDALGPLAWRPDGSGVVYAYRTAPMLPTQLVAVTLAEPTMVGVTNPVSGQPGDSQPALASTGRRLAFERSRSVGVADLAMIETSVGQVEFVTRDGVELHGSAWEPGGRSLVYASPRGGRSELWRSRLDGSAELLLAERGSELRAPAVSADGRRLAYERWHLRTRLLAVPLTGDLDQPPVTWLEAGAYDRDAQLSPDGTRVAFLSDRGGRDRLWLTDATGVGAPRALAGLEIDGLQSPRWSPDGRRLVVAGRSGGRAGLWIVDAASGESARLAIDGQSLAPSFSRDGSWLYYANDSSGRWEVWRRQWPEGGRVEQLTTQGGLAAQESRAGDELYFVRPDRNGLWMRSREPGGDDALVFGELAAADWNNWFVAEDGVYFVARPDRENPQLAKWSYSGAAVQPIRPLPGLLPRSGLTPTADRRAVLVAQLARTEVDLGIATLE